ncbi:MAG: hypothetical protein PVF43_09500, partial [Candidatus Eiseniibacteriota bacterium]
MSDQDDSKTTRQFTPGRSPASRSPAAGQTPSTGPGGTDTLMERVNRLVAESVANMKDASQSFAELVHSLVERAGEAGEEVSETAQEVGLEVGNRVAWVIGALLPHRDKLEFELEDAGRTVVASVLHIAGRTDLDTAAALRTGSENLVRSTAAHGAGVRLVTEGMFEAVFRDDRLDAAAKQDAARAVLAGARAGAAEAGGDIPEQVRQAAERFRIESAGTGSPPGR